MEVSVDRLRELSSQIAEVDAKLDAASGSAPGERYIINNLVSENSDQASVLAEQIIEFLSNTGDMGELVGVMNGAFNRVEATYKEDVDKFLSAEVTAAKNSFSDVKLEEEQILREIEDRNKLKKEFDMLKELLLLYVDDDEEEAISEIEAVPVPRRKNTPSGKKRGPVIWNQFQYAIDGENLEGDNNSLSYIASLFNMKVGDLKSSVFEPAGITKDIDQPTWEVTLPDGRPLTATVMAEFAENFVSETEESEEDTEVEDDEDLAEFEDAE